MHSMKLKYDNSLDDGTYSAQESVKINGAKNKSLTIKLSEGISLSNSSDGNKEFSDIKLTLDGKEIVTDDVIDVPEENGGVTELKLTAKAPKEATAGSTYKGTATLVIEEKV
jgi:CS1 type fimbrial major subunit